MRTSKISTNDTYPVNSQYSFGTNGGTQEEQTSAETAGKELSGKELDETVSKLNKMAEIFGLSIEYRITVHEETKRQIVQIVKDDKVINEIPPTRVLDALAKIEEDMLGLVVDEKF